MKLACAYLKKDLRERLSSRLRTAARKGSSGSAEYTLRAIHFSLASTSALHCIAVRHRHIIPCAHGPCEDTTLSAEESSQETLQVSGRTADVARPEGDRQLSDLLAHRLAYVQSWICGLILASTEAREAAKSSLHAFVSDVRLGSPGRGFLALCLDSNISAILGLRTERERPPDRPSS